MTALVARLGRLQQSRGYKTTASIVWVVAIIAVVAGMWVYANRPASDIPQASELAALAAPTGVIELGPIGAVRSAASALLSQLTTTEGLLTAAAFAGVIATCGVVVIWLGLSLTYLAWLVLGWGVAWPLMVFEPTRTLGRLLFGIVPLMIALTTLMQVARLALGAPTPTMAVAKNVLNEAVRMRISAVFIVILLLMLAVTPTVLTEDQALRYRVQQWMTYGLLFSFGTLALLTVFLTVASVSFEQRDKIIWQTMTKPVRPLHYLLGKWLGVMVLNLVLLTVSAAGVFLFTEYLRYQPADGEIAYRVDERGNRTGLGTGNPISRDRELLETQVLAARVAVEPFPFRLTDEAVEYYASLAVAYDSQYEEEDRPLLREQIRDRVDDSVDLAVRERLQKLVDQAESFTASQRDIAAKEGELREEVVEGFEVSSRIVPPGNQKTFVFDLRDQWRKWERVRDRGLRLVESEIDRLVAEGRLDRDDQRAVEEQSGELLQRFMAEGLIEQPANLTLRFTVDAGTNDPTQIYDVFFFFNGRPWPATPEMPRSRWGLQRVGLGHAASVDFPVGILQSGRGEQFNGYLELDVISAQVNPRTLSFAPGKLEVLYDAGGYQLNFLRTIATMWVKLAFIAAVGVSLATFLSFPVAALVTLAVLFAAESSDFLAEALENYVAKDIEGNTKVHAVAARMISLPVAWIFETYGNLKPAESIASGRLISWSTLGWAILILGAWASALLAMGWLVFRRRELAIYSGN